LLLLLVLVLLLLLLLVLVLNMERAHMQAAEELESLYEKKLSIEAQRYRALLHEKVIGGSFGDI